MTLQGDGNLPSQMSATMKIKLPVVLVLSGFLIFGCESTGTDSMRLKRSAEPWPKYGQRWEYAEFGNHLVKRGPDTFSWQTPTGYVATHDISALMKQLPHPQPIGHTPSLSILTAVGEDGWEMITHEGIEYTNGDYLDVWVFKRPAR